MSLLPEARAFLHRMAATPQPYEVSLEDFREAARALIPGGEKLPLARVEDLVIAGGAGQSLGVRIYIPQVPAPAPVLVWAHGGSFARGTLDMFDAARRAFAKAAGTVVVAVDQRLSPEAQFPGPLEDVFATLRWVCGQARALGVDLRRLGVAGESSGGNLAAAAARLARDRGLPLAAQLLVSPLLDATLSSPSVADMADGYLLTRRQLEWAYSQYAPEVRPQEPLLSPLLATDLLDLAPAGILTMEFDPVRDEGERYAARLREAGVPVRMARLPGVLHHFPGPDFGPELVRLWREILAL